MDAAFFRLSVSFSIILSVSIAASASEPTCVGDRGDHDQLIIDGCKTFSSKELKSSLFTDLGLLLAAHPSAPLDSYCETLRDKITMGYLHMGFPDAKVDVEVDRSSQKIYAHIEEGNRYLAEDIVVKGNRNVPASTIIRWISEPCPPEGARLAGFIGKNDRELPRWIDKNDQSVNLEDPLWKTSSPATFDKISIETIKARTKRAFSDYGYFFPAFQVKVVPEEDDKKATLHVEVFSEGPKAMLGEINIVGNELNSPDEFVEYLKLEQGKPFTGERLIAWQERLWRSGRFISSNVTVDPPPVGSDQVKLNIDVLESPWAPNLSEPLSKEQIILLKLRDRLINPANWGGDLCVVARVPGGIIDFVVSPSRGMLARYHGKTKGKNAESLPVEMSAVVSDTFAGMLCPTPLKEKICIDMIDFPMVPLYGELGLYLNDGPDNVDQPQAIRIGCWTRSLEKNKNPPRFEFYLNISPAYCVALTNVKGVKECKIEDGILSIRNQEELYRIDAENGRHFDYTRFEEDNGDPIVSVRLQADAFERQLAEIQSESAECPNVFNNDMPFESILVYIAGEKKPDFFVKNATIRNTLQVFRKLYEKNAFSPHNEISKTLKRYCNFQPIVKCEFNIPPFIPEGMGPSKFSQSDHYLVLGLVLADKLFPRRSWPWAFSREIMLVVSGRGQYATAETENLLTSKNNGPIFYLLSSCLFANFSPQHAELFASEGLTRLSTAEFQNDCRILLDPDFAIGQYVQQMAAAIRKLTPEDIAELLNSPSFNNMPLLHKCVEALHSQPDRPFNDVLLEVLSDAWESELRDQVKAKLTEISSSNCEI